MFKIVVKLTFNLRLKCMDQKELCSFIDKPNKYFGITIQLSYVLFYFSIHLLSTYSVIGRMHAS